jgi:hypothetical protein
MRHLLLAAAFALAAAVASPAAAQVQVQLRLDLPVVLPGLVVIEPGIQVVPNVSEEVFFVDGYYWVRRDNHWYRSHDHRRGWVVVEHGRVPPRLVRVPDGYYRRWEPSRGHHDRVERREDRREDRRDDRRDDRKERKDDRQDRREDRKDDRREGK